MTRKRTKTYKKGQVLTAYINNSVDDEILEWVNKQTDVTGLIFLALLSLYEQTGNIDVVDYVPRRYSPDVPLPDFPLRDKESQNEYVTRTRQVTNVNENTFAKQIKRIEEPSFVPPSEPVEESPPLIKRKEDNSETPTEDEEKEHSLWNGGLEGIDIDNI